MVGRMTQGIYYVWSAPRADDRPSPNFGVTLQQLAQHTRSFGSTWPPRALVRAGVPSAIMSSRHAALIAEAEAPATPSHSKVRHLAQPLLGFGSEATMPS